MKRFEKLAIALIILWIIQWIVTSLTPIWIYQLLGDDTSTETFESAHLALTCASIFINFITNIICGFWLYSEAKRANQSKWIWCAAGFVFKLPAIMIFLAYIILKEPRNKIPNQHPDPARAKVQSLEQ